MPREVVGGRQMSREEIKATVQGLPKAGQKAQEEQAMEVVQDEQALRAAALAVPSDAEMTPRERMQSAQAFSNWLRGETLAGRQLPTLEEQRRVRIGLNATLLRQRPGGQTAFQKFLGM